MCVCVCVCVCARARARVRARACVRACVRLCLLRTGGKVPARSGRQTMPLRSTQLTICANVSRDYYTFIDLCQYRKSIGSLYLLPVESILPLCRDVHGQDGVAVVFVAQPGRLPQANVESLRARQCVAVRPYTQLVMNERPHATAGKLLPTAVVTRSDTTGVYIYTS